MANRPTGGFLLSVNIPNRPDADRLPRVVTRLGRRHAAGDHRQINPRSETIYWIGPAGDAHDAGGALTSSPRPMARCPSRRFKWT